MHWLIVYVTVAVGVLSIAGACSIEGVRRDPARIAAIIAAAALWPVLAVGLIQLGFLRWCAVLARRHETGPVTPVEAGARSRIAKSGAGASDPATPPAALIDSPARVARRAGARHPA